VDIAGTEASCVFNLNDKKKESEKNGETRRSEVRRNPELLLLKYYRKEQSTESQVAVCM
jgi:hypothetical protein